VKVLIADDDKRFRDFIKQVLEVEADENLTLAAEAADGEEAVRLAQNLKPDVVIMDLDMPSVDGLEATRRIKAELQKTRVVMLSALSGETYEKAAAKFGVDVFLPKETRISDILTIIRGGPRQETGNEQTNGCTRGAG
jgi:DNA-binding NarL/FixJ family response regulator